MFKKENIVSDNTIDIKPPKGMKTVLHNGNPVGYVPDTGDPHDVAESAKQLYIKKGLWIDIPIEKSIYDQAVSFANSSNLIYEKDLKKTPRNGQGITPFVVNAAFSAELYLKCLLKTCGKDIHSHTLTALFKALPNKIKDKINKHKKQLEAEYDVEKNALFKEHLKNINNAFINWRYVYEKNDEYIHIPTTIFVLHVLHQTSVDVLNIET